VEKKKLTKDNENEDEDDGKSKKGSSSKTSTKTSSKKTVRHEDEILPGESWEDDL